MFLLLHRRVTLLSSITCSSFLWLVILVLEKARCFSDSLLITSKIFLLPLVCSQNPCFHFHPSFYSCILDEISVFFQSSGALELFVWGVNTYYSNWFWFCCDENWIWLNFFLIDFDKEWHKVIYVNMFTKKLFLSICVWIVCSELLICVCVLPLWVHFWFWYVWRLLIRTDLVSRIDSDLTYPNINHIWG